MGEVADDQVEPQGETKYVISLDSFQDHTCQTWIPLTLTYVQFALTLVVQFL